MPAIPINEKLPTGSSNKPVILQSLEKIDISNSWYLPVLTRERDFVGFVSKTKVFKRYREILADQGDLY